MTEEHPLYKMGEASPLASKAVDQRNPSETEV